MKLILNLPKYEVAESNLISQVFEGFIMLDSLVGKVSKQQISHEGPTRIIHNDIIFEQTEALLSQDMLLAVETIHTSNIGEYTIFLYDYANSYIEKTKKWYLEKITAACDAFGNTVDANGEKISYSLLTQLYDKIYFDFDEEGNPIYPQLVMPPNLYEAIKNIKPTAEEEAQFKSMLERKKMEFYAKKSSRRLS